MTAKVNIAGVWKDARLLGRIADAWKPLVVWQNVAGAWKRVTASGSGGSLSATAEPSYVSGARTKQTAAPVTTNSTTITATGGVGAYTYAWGAQSGWTISNPSSLTTNFTALAVEADESRDQIFVCTVTDAIGGTVDVTVSASASNYYVGGGNGPLS